MINKAIEKACKDKRELARLYNTDENKVVWCGNNKYIVILRNGRRIRI